MVDLHEPVLVRPVLEFLLHRPDGVYADLTVGTGGHAEAILRALGPGGRLICADQDPEVLEIARRRLEALESRGDAQAGEHGEGVRALHERVHFHRASFSDFDRVLAAEGLGAVDGILLDLGLNTWTLARPEVGQSYQTEGPLRMVVDPDLTVTAEQFLARAREEELARVFTEFAEVRRPRLYARRIVEARRQRPLRTTADLVRVLSGGKPGALPASELSRLFQALRVEVGREMERLDLFLERAGDWIRPGGRLVILSYASHEDRRVKDLTRRGEGTPGAFVPLLRSPLRPGEDEVRTNRRARSAKLRCFERRDT